RLAHIVAVNIPHDVTERPDPSQEVLAFRAVSSTLSTVTSGRNGKRPVHPQFPCSRVSQVSSKISGALERTRRRTSLCAQRCSAIRVTEDFLLACRSKAPPRGRIMAQMRSSTGRKSKPRTSYAKVRFQCLLPGKS